MTVECTPLYTHHEGRAAHVSLLRDDSKFPLNSRNHSKNNVIKYREVKDNGVMACVAALVQGSPYAVGWPTYECNPTRQMKLA